MRARVCDLNAVNLTEYVHNEIDFDMIKRSKYVNPDFKCLALSHNGFRFKVCLQNK